MRTPPPFPPAIATLTSLRYLAAAWVVLFHFSHFAKAALLTDVPVIAGGYLGVDFFFVLSGFVLAHVYQRQIDAGRFDFWMFVVKRFARIYPMHLLMLACFVGVGLATRHAGLQVDDLMAGVSFRGMDDAVLFRALIANLTLIHAWGATPFLFFNQPSWSISAEWFAYLAFPVLVLLLRLPPRGAGGKLVAVALLFVAMAILWQVAVHGELTKLTWNVGILRIFPEFLIGMSLRRFGAGWSASPRGAVAGLAAAVLLSGGALTLAAAVPGAEIPLATVAVLGLAGIVFFAADADRHDRLRWARRPLPVLLGEISYSVYMIHFAVWILWSVVVPPADAALLAVMQVAGALLVTTALSWVTYHAIELPARDWLTWHGRRLNRVPAAQEKHDAV